MEPAYLQVIFHLKTLDPCPQLVVMYQEITVAHLTLFLTFSSWVTIQFVPQQHHQLPTHHPHHFHHFTLVITVTVIWLETLQWAMALLVLGIIPLIQTLTITNHPHHIILASHLVSMVCMDHHLPAIVSTLNWLIS